MFYFFECSILSCLDCDGDPYCKRCFKEQHGRNNLDQHETEPISRSKA